MLPRVIGTVNCVGKFCRGSQHWLSRTQLANVGKVSSNFTWQLGVAGAPPRVAELSLIVVSVPFSLSLGSLEIQILSRLQ